MSEPVRNFIAGSWVAGRGRTVDRPNPADPATIVSTTTWADTAQVEEAVDHVHHGYRAWADTSPEHRADVLGRAADILADRAAQLTDEIVAEEGKTRAEAAIEARRTPQNLRMYATAALNPTGTTYPTGTAASSTPRGSRSGWWPPSRPGTSRSTSRPASSARPWPPATGSS